MTTNRDDGEQSAQAELGTACGVRFSVYPRSGGRYEVKFSHAGHRYSHRLPREVDGVRLDLPNARAQRADYAAAFLAETIKSAGAGDDLGPDATAQEVGETWTGGKLAKLYPDHVKPKRSADDDASRLKLYVYPRIGPKRLRDVTLDDCERVMKHLPEALASASRRQVAQLLSRLLKLAVYPLKIREASPLPSGWLPRVKSTKAFDYLKPAEESQLEAHTDIPLARRLLWGCMYREGLRCGEAERLEWSDLDLDVGAISLDVNKTDEPRRWALDAGVAEALRAWRKLQDVETDHVFRDRANSVNFGRLAEQVRDDTRAAGIERASLYESTERRGKLRAHDLRASFVTWALANEKTEAWVMDRTGHKSSAMIQRYRRKARMWSEVSLGVPAALSEALPEIREQLQADAAKRAQATAAATATAAEATASTSTDPEQLPAAESFVDGAPGQAAAAEPTVAPPVAATVGGCVSNAAIHHEFSVGPVGNDPTTNGLKVRCSTN